MTYDVELSNALVSVIVDDLKKDFQCVDYAHENNVYITLKAYIVDIYFVRDYIAIEFISVSRAVWYGRIDVSYDEAHRLSEIINTNVGSYVPICWLTTN